MTEIAFDVRASAVADGAFVISVVGEADLYTAPALREEMLGALAAGAKRLVVDLSDVTFIDSTSIGTLVRAERELRASGGTISVVANDPNIVRVFRITALDRLFPIYATRAEAIAALSPPAADGGRDGRDGSRR